MYVFMFIYNRNTTERSIEFSFFIQFIIENKIISVYYLPLGDGTGEWEHNWEVYCNCIYSDGGGWVLNEWFKVGSEWKSVIDEWCGECGMMMMVLNWI